MPDTPASSETTALDLIVGLLPELDEDFESTGRRFFDRLCEALCRLASLERAGLVLYDEARRLVVRGPAWASRAGRPRPSSAARCRRHTAGHPERLSLAEAGGRYLAHLEGVVGRKRATLQDYRLILDRQLVPFFGERAIDRIGPDDVTAFLVAQDRRGFARQTIVNRLNLLGGIYSHAMKRGWTAANPVAAVDRPRSEGADPDIRFLTAAQVEALVRAVPDVGLGPTQRAIYLTAAMTGLRQGELIALGWQDVDWTAGLLRVRRTYSRGEFGTPKSRRSSRAVPMADRVAGELERHFQRSHYRADSDLVFCHPNTGQPFDASRLRKDFRKALARAGVREVRFHDLRHTYGTAMAGAGAPIRSLMEWMGHADLSTTLRYADYSPSQAQGAAFAERAFGRTPKVTTAWRPVAV
jgi:integrase